MTERIAQPWKEFCIIIIFPGFCLFKWLQKTLLVIAIDEYNQIFCNYNTSPKEDPNYAYWVLYQPNIKFFKLAGN